MLSARARSKPRFWAHRAEAFCAVGKASMFKSGGVFFWFLGLAIPVFLVLMYLLAFTDKKVGKCQIGRRNHDNDEVFPPRASVHCTRRKFCSQAAPHLATVDRKRVGAHKNNLRP